MEGQQDLPTVMITVVIVFTILAAGTFAINSASEATTSSASTESADQTALLDGTEKITLANRVGRDEEVYNSLGYAANFTGANDSYLESTDSPELGTVGNWTVQTWARVDAGSETNNMTLVAASGDVLLQYNGSNSNWTAYYYDRASRQSWRADVSAPKQPANWTLVTATANATHFWIYANATKGEVVDITGSNSADYGTYGNFDGRIDETRTFNDTTNDSQVSAAVADPIAPRKSRARTGRIMYDEPSRATQRFFFATGDAATSNVTFSTGLPGELMDGKSFTNDVTGTTDYRWYVVGPAIKPVSGGQLDGAPAAYVTYQASGRLNTLADDWNSVMGIAAILIVLLPLGTILGYLYTVRESR